MRNFKFFICLSLIFIITFFTFTSCLANEAIYVWSNNRSETANVSSTITEDSSSNNSLNLECESAILIEQSTGKILYSHNEHEQLRPASVTKIMSI